MSRPLVAAVLRRRGAMTRVTPDAAVPRIAAPRAPAATLTARSTLTDLRDDETLLVRSGRPVGMMRTPEWAPRVLIADSKPVGDWATWPEFRRLEQLGLTMYGQMTAGSRIAIGRTGSH